jgi:hypothetical protein
MKDKMIEIWKMVQIFLMKKSRNVRDFWKSGVRASINASLHRVKKQWETLENK